MPLTKQQKEQVVSGLADKLTQSQTLIFTHFAKIPVEKLKELRRELRVKGAEYRVAKKTLLRVALKKAGVNLMRCP